VREGEILEFDDLGSENSTAWATEQRFQTINHRYTYRMPTVSTTNSRLFEQLDERIAARLSDTRRARTVVVEAQSRRPRAGRQAPPLPAGNCRTTSIWPESPKTVPFFDICWYDLRHRPRSGQHTDADHDATWRGFGAVFR
jgi:hypothetical protein